MEDERIKDLYAAPLDEFTMTRDALARELKDKGDKGQAAVVKRLKKPTLDAWAVNQLARSRAHDIGRLVQTTEEISKASSGDDLRDLVQKRHGLVAELVHAAGAILEEQGHGATSSTEHRISQTLYSATTPQELDSLRNGTLARGLEASGFGTQLAVEPEEPKKKERKTKRERDREEVQERLDGAQREAVRLQQEAERARKEADAAEHRAATAQREVVTLQRRLERLSKD